MKIGYLTSSSTVQNAGWNRFTNDLVSGVEKLGHETVVHTDTVLSKKGWRRLSSLIGESRKARAALSGCDIIHALDAYPAGVIAWASRLKQPLVVTAQGTYSIAPLYRFPTSIAGKRAVHSANMVTAISRYTAEEVLRATGRTDIQVITHGINLEKFLRPRLPREQFILSVGQLKERKGYAVSIPAFAQFRKSFPDFRYTIVAEWGDQDHFKKIAAEHGVGDAVDFLGTVSDSELVQLYQSASLFVQLSVNDNHHFEGFGLIFLEAAAAGLPVVGTLGNGIEDAVHDGINGILVPQHDVARAAEAMSAIVSDEVKWNSMSAASYEWAKAHELSQVVAQYTALYERVVLKK